MAPLTLAIDQQKGELRLSSEGNTETAQYALEMDREDDQGELTFYHDDIELDPGDTAIATYGNWTRGKPMPLGIDHGSKGTIDQTLELSDASQ